MEKIQLIAFLTIQGIGAASGIVFHNKSLFIISDNSGYLYEQKLDASSLEKHELIENASANIEKKRKPDFEAMTLKENELHIFGSGSTNNRNKKIIYNLSAKTINQTDFSNSYQELKTKFKISNEDLNIEGAVYVNEDLLLFQRGNGLTSKNGIFKISPNNESAFFQIVLPKIKHVEATFTDAILIKNKIYFLAAAEDTNSTYHDGEVLGSIIGIIDSKTLNLEKTIQISDKHKFEGLTLYHNSKKEIEFLLCEDNDTDELKTIIYKLKLNTNN